MLSRIATYVNPAYYTLYKNFLWPVCGVLFNNDRLTLFSIESFFFDNIQIYFQFEICDLQKKMQNELLGKLFGYTADGH